MKIVTTAFALMAMAFAATSVGFAGGKSGNRGVSFRGGHHASHSFHGNRSFGGSKVAFQQKQFHSPSRFQHNHNQNIHHKKFHIHQNFGQRNFLRNVAFAAPKFHRTLVRHHNYHLSHGTKFAYGYCYQGHHHNHWVSNVHCQQLGCTIYYCPYTSCWYYWNDAYDCYFPVNYFPTGI